MKHAVRTSLDALQLAHAHAARWLEGLDDRPVNADASLTTLRARLGGELPARPSDARDVVNELVRATDRGHLGCASGRFFAWVIGGALPSALAADWLVSTWDQNAALHATAPASAVVEEIAGAWLAELLDLPRDASFAFTTGCQLAHFTALAAARHAMLAKAGWDVRERGLFGAPAVRVITGAQRHGSIDRALAFLGFGRAQTLTLPVDDDGRMIAAALEEALAKDATPAIVVLGAADLNVAAFDDFATLIPLAKAAGAWVHVDGAFGLFARASRAHRAPLTGVERGDSWATDAHKWLNVPFDTGVAFVRDRAAHRAAMTIAASYIATSDDARDPIDWTPEWSRRARGFAIWAALRELGREGVEALVDRTCAHARAIVERAAELPNVEALHRPTLNQGLLRFLDPRPGAGEGVHDARTERVIAAVNASGEAFFSPTSWRGRRAMRVSVVNWRTDERDVERAVAAIARALEDAR